MKKGVLAVAHKLIVLVHLLIREGGVYRERGGDFFDRLNPERTARKLAKRLERIGYTVALARRSPDDYLLKPRPPIDPNRPVIGADICGRCHEQGRTDCYHLIKRPKRSSAKIKPTQIN